MEEQEGEKWRKSEMKESERWIKKRLIGERKRGGGYRKKWEWAMILVLVH